MVDVFPGNADHQPILNFKYPLNNLDAINGPLSSPSAADSDLRLRWNSEGWIVDEMDNFLIWIPGEYRNCLWWPQMRKLIGGYELQVKIDFASARHGTEWTMCIAEDDIDLG